MTIFKMKEDVHCLTVVKKKKNLKNNRFSALSFKLVFLLAKASNPLNTQSLMHTPY